MIRIHQVWPYFPIPDNTDVEIAQATVLTSTEVASIFKKFEDNVLLTREDNATPREEAAKLRASANYVAYFIVPAVLSPKMLIDLVLDLTTRPKRTVIVLARLSESTPVNDTVKDTLTHLFSQFESNDFIYCDRLYMLMEFLLSHQPQKPQEAQP